MSTRPQTTEKAPERQSAVRVADAVADFPADLPADLDGEISASPESTRSAPRAPRPLPAAPPTLAPAEQIDARAIWRQLQSDFALHQPAGSIDSVIQDSWVIAYEDGEFIIGIADAFRLDWVEKKLRNQIKRRLAVIMGRATVDVKFRVQPKPVVDPPHARATPLYDQVAVVQHIDCEDAPLVAPRPMNPPVVAAAAVVELPARTVLNPKFLLERFVVGKSNRLAHAAALTVAEQPGAMNPVFFYGGVGLGKTHLLQAITARINATGLKALYCTSEEFTNDLVAAIRSQSTDAFRAKYRNVDVLAVDDIQFIGNKASTQEEFFHTFNFLHSAGKQIILAADRKPRDLAGVEDRLRNRFEGGIAAQLQAPDYEDRVEILSAKAQHLGCQLPLDVLMLIAERADGNIRELEGALNRISLQVRIQGVPATVRTADVLLDSPLQRRTLCAPAQVVALVAAHFGLAATDLTGRRRTAEIAHARQVAMYLLREEHALTLPNIGELVGGRDHTTVRHGVARIAELLREDERVRRDLAHLREQLATPA